MATYEDYIQALEEADGLPSDVVEAAQDALSFVAALHDLYVTQGVLNTDAPINLSVLENLIDAYHGELAAAALLLAEDIFVGVSDHLRSLEKDLDDPDKVVPVAIRKGFLRLANRIEQVRRLQEIVKNIPEGA